MVTSVGSQFTAGADWLVSYIEQMPGRSFVSVVFECHISCKM